VLNDVARVASHSSTSVAVRSRSFRGPEVRKHVLLAQMTVRVTCRLVAATEAVLKPVLNCLTHRVAVPREDHTIFAAAEEVAQLRLASILVRP
jgi:hypothetical protein